MATTSVQYTAPGGQELFTVPFGFLRSSDLTVTVAGVSKTFTVEGSSVRITPAPTTGQAVIIQRETDIDLPIVDWENSSVVTAQDLDLSTLQMVYSLQEFQNVIAAGIGGGGGGGGGASVPTPVASNTFMYSTPDGAGGYQWSIGNVATIQGILGIGGGASVPAPLAGLRMIVTDPASNIYTLKTLAETVAILGIPDSTRLLPYPSGFVNFFFMSHGDGINYAFRSPADVRSILGLGSCALANVGTTVGAVPQLIASGISGAALPAVSGEFLTNVAKATRYAVWERAGATMTQVPTTWAEYNGVSLAYTNPSGGGAAWAAVANNRPRVDLGKYYIKLTFVANPSEITDTGKKWPRLECRFRPSNGSMDRASVQGPPLKVGFGTGGVVTAEGIVQVTSANCEILCEMEARQIDGAGTYYAIIPATSSELLMRVEAWKIE